ncbi:hypothetical protein L226DRAFT_568568 [Lentinus tigrinus ALCF2SS1-7]|uniref:uncharacterized protein n=1 Tax=Lentinus tigrinus ALCF2SS1-7 TaxID=1328758 RepID=UPI001166281E|nr:hypothetical protein L226DRAFT_568568 [Lentinus tigrinus ALCF2SS1-7]
MGFVEDTMGWLLIGVLLSAALWGVSLAQAFSYYIGYPGDRPYLKFLVATVSALETIHQGVISYAIFHYLALTAVVVQSFFAVRIYRFSSKKLVVVPVIGLIITAFAYAAKASSLTVFAELDKLKALSLAMNVSAAVTDVTIAVILCTLLHVSKTGHARSNRLVNKLITFTVNTGLLTSTCACLSLITYLALPDYYFVYMAPFLLMGRLYSNSLLATLNTRERLREDLNGSLNEIAMGHIQCHPSRSVHLDLELNETLPRVASTISSNPAKISLESPEAPKTI